MTRETLKFKNVLFGHVGFVGQKFSQEFLKLVVAYNVQRIQAISKLCSNVFSETKVDVSGLGNSLKSQHMTFFFPFSISVQVRRFCWVETITAIEESVFACLERFSKSKSGYYFLMTRNA